MPNMRQSIAAPPDRLGQRACRGGGTLEVPPESVFFGLWGPHGAVCKGKRVAPSLRSLKSSTTWSNVPEISASLSIGWFLEFVPAFIGCPLFWTSSSFWRHAGCQVLLEQQLCATRPARKTSAIKPANGRKFEECSVENTNLGHLSIARAEIEESRTNCVFKKRATKGYQWEGPGRIGFTLQGL